MVSRIVGGYSVFNAIIREPKTAGMVALLAIVSAAQFFRSANENQIISLVMRMGPIFILNLCYTSGRISFSNCLKIGLIAIGCLLNAERRLWSKPTNHPPLGGSKQTPSLSEPLGVSSSSGLPQDPTDGITRPNTTDNELFADESNVVDSIGATGGVANQDPVTHMLAPVGHIDAPRVGELFAVVGKLSAALGGGVIGVIGSAVNISFKQSYPGLFSISCKTDLQQQGWQSIDAFQDFIKGKLDALTVSRADSCLSVLRNYELEMILSALAGSMSIELLLDDVFNGFCVAIIERIDTKDLSTNVDVCQHVANILYGMSRLVLDQESEKSYCILQRCYDVYSLMPESVRYQFFRQMPMDFLGLRAWMNICVYLKPSEEKNRIFTVLTNQEIARVKDPCIQWDVFIHLAICAKKAEQSGAYKQCIVALCHATITMPSTYRKHDFGGLVDFQSDLMDGKDIIATTHRFISGSAYTGACEIGCYHLLMTLLLHYNSITLIVFNSLATIIKNQIEALPNPKDKVDRWVDFAWLLSVKGSKREEYWDAILRGVTELHPVIDKEVPVKLAKIILLSSLDEGKQKNYLRRLDAMYPVEEKQRLRDELQVCFFDCSQLDVSSKPRRRK